MAARCKTANGYDIVFTSDAAGQNPLDFEIDNYNGANGTARVLGAHFLCSRTRRIPRFYMWYGNPNISSTQENIAGVWRNSYLSVYHLGNGTSIGTTDSGSAGYTLAQSGSVSPVAGVIGGGAAFNGDPGSYLYHDSGDSLSFRLNRAGNTGGLGADSHRGRRSVRIWVQLVERLSDCACIDCERSDDGI